MTLRFHVLPQRFALVRLSAADAIPSWSASGAFFSITRTAEELSILCEDRLVPEGVQSERGWQCLALAGPFALSEIGIAAEFTSVLARSRISVLVMSTFDTDYVFVRQADLERASAALVDAGHHVTR